MALRTAGYTFDAIARECDYSTRAAAYRAVMALLRRRESAAAADLRRLEDARLDAVTRRLSAELSVLPVGADPANAARLATALMRVSESRRRLHGVDLAAQPEVVNIQAQADMDQLKRVYAARMDQLRELAGRGVLDADVVEEER